MAKIIQIYTDDLGYGDLGCYGHPFASTPNLDSLATNGRKFNQFHVASPVCSPSRCGLITGTMPQFFHIHDADRPEVTRRYWIPWNTPTIARRLATHERLTGTRIHRAHFGKWHLGEPPLAQLPTQLGFEYFWGSLGGRPSSSWLPYARYNDPQMVEIAQTIGAMTTRSGWADQLHTDQCIAWLDTDGGDGKPRNGNFFVEIWTYWPHEPLTTNLPPEVIALYSGRTTAEQAYYGSITMGDIALGTLLSQLSAWGILNDTIIMFASDNGPEVGGLSAGTAAPLKGNKTTMWQGGICVPMLMQGPGITAGSVDNEVRSALDWPSTVLDIFGIAGDAALNGRSLLDTGLAEYPLFWEYHKPQRGVTGPAHAMRRGKWKLLSTTTPQLYDLDADPGETTDLAGTETAKRDELDAELTAWLATLPAETSGSSGVATPGTEAEANAIAPAPTAVPRYCRPGSAGDMTTLSADIDTLLGLPRAAPCSHGVPGATESTYGSSTTTHPTLGGTSLLFLDGIETALDDPTNRARCNGTELANLDDRIRNGFGKPQA